MPYKLAISLSILWASCVMTVMADEARWLQYVTAAMEADQRGDPEEAIRQSQFALKESEDFGEEDPRFAASLSNLALLYDDQGRYAEAEPLFKRALTINEKALGREHPNTRLALENLSALNQAQGPFGFLTRLLREYGLQ